MALISILLAIFEFLLIVFAGIVAGLLGSLTGLGGGTVLVPVLTLFYGIPIIFAAGASLVSTIATSSGSASSYVKSKIANIKVGLGLEIATTLGAIVGSLALVYVHNIGIVWVIYVIFGIVLLGSLIPTISKMAKGPYQIRPADWTTKFFQLTGIYHDARTGTDIPYNGIRWWLGEIIMFFAGVLSGLLGIGSGVMNVLGMDWAMALPLKVTTTTSNFMIGITAAAGSSIYWFEGYVQPFIAAATAIGVLVGSFFGAKLLVKMSSTNVRWLFFWILAFLGFEMVFKGLYSDSVIKIGQAVQFGIAMTLSALILVGLFVFFRRRGVTG